MLNFKIIGAGAAGNKAAIALAESGFNLNDITLINSTSRDLPEKYKDDAIIFGAKSSTLGGCGKERDVGKKLILRDMKNGDISFDGIADPDTNAVIIVSSTEGGSGSAITPIVAKYIKEVVGLPVIVVLFFGFNTDVRGMQNSIEIAQELEDTYGVIAISNAKFLDEASGNSIKAEKLANERFVQIVKDLSGTAITPGSQNIDNTDLFKLIATPGYMIVENANISKIKNIDQYKKAVSSAIDESHLIDCSSRGAKRIGIIYDISDDLTDYIDFGETTIQSAYGIPYEMFTHVQDTKKGTVTWIATGLPLPIEEIREIYENYLKASMEVNKSKDSFFDSIMELRGNEEDGQFNMLSINKLDNNKSKASFFADFGISDTKKNDVKTTKGAKEGTAKEY